MKTKRKTLLVCCPGSLVLAGWLLSIALLLPMSAFAATQYFSHSEGLANSSRQTIQGTRTADGGCRWTPPALQLEPSQDVIESRQVSADWDTCTSVIETGTPVHASDPDIPDGSSENVSAGTDPESEPEPQPAPCRPWLPCEMSSSQSESTTSSNPTAAGRMVAWWEDVVHLVVTKTRSHLSWSYNFSNVTSQHGYGSTAWRSRTGWSRTRASSLITPLRPWSTYSRVRTDAEYRNPWFCRNVVYNDYDDVTVRGGREGRLRGSVGSSWSSHCDDGPDLHYHQRLIRERPSASS
jgi:hypothetical protein